MNFNILPLLISLSSGLLVLFVQQFARPYFAVHSIWLDSAPNFIVGLCFPFCILIRPKLLTRTEARKYFTLCCIATLLLLIAFEIERPFRGAETFDWLDILASFTGITAAFLFYRVRLEKKLIFCE
ncbi:MAG: hypothetical protein ABWZ66_10170 [Pyrinomonadaceae bacterium]